MKGSLIKGLFLSMLVLAIFSAGISAQTYASNIKVAAVKSAPAAPAADWEQKWNKVLAEAKKEGKVVLYTRWTLDVRTALTRAFKNKYGLDLEFSPFARGSDLLVKLQAEQRAGLNLVDVLAMSNTDLLVSLKPHGLLGPIAPLLILPEVLNPKAWRSGQVPYTDKDGLAFSMIMNAARLVVYNKNLVQEGKITSVKDLLDPQYKGKITLNDPTVTGAGNALMAHLGHNLWGEAEASNFLRRLIKDQEATIQRDSRLQIETVARGKHAVALGEDPPNVEEFFKAGAPIKLAVVKEDNRASSATGCFGLPHKFVHPNATIVFLNWLLTKEGQSVFATSFGNASTRLDASIEGINPDFIPKFNEKYYTQDEPFMMASDKWLKLAKQIIDEAQK